MTYNVFGGTLNPTLLLYCLRFCFIDVSCHAVSVDAVLIQGQSQSYESYEASLFALLTA